MKKETVTVVLGRVVQNILAGKEPVVVGGTVLGVLQAVLAAAASLGYVTLDEVAAIMGGAVALTAAIARTVRKRVTPS